MSTTRTKAFAEASELFMRFFLDTPYSKKLPIGGIDLTFGNPHEPVIPQLVTALQAAAVPQQNDWFKYMISETDSRKVIATSLKNWRHVDFDVEDIAVTNAGFGALSVSIKALTVPGEEVIFNLPPWFFYEVLCADSGLKAVKVRVNDDFDLDVEAIAAAITPRTRIVIVNTPNNPTGRVYPAATLTALARVLERASAQHGKPIYIVSDEPYSRLVFDDVTFVSPTSIYSHAIMTYSYGKVLLAPGQRIGFIAISPLMPLAERKLLRHDFYLTQTAGGFMFPNSLLQHALADLDRISIDVGRLQTKRDRIVAALRWIGYECAIPEGTFYLLPKCPWKDDFAFCLYCMDQTPPVLLLPGTVCEIPGYFRISLTATDDMLDRALPVLAKAFEHAKTKQM